MTKLSVKVVIGLFLAVLGSTPGNHAPSLAVAKSSKPCAALKPTEGVRLHMVSDFYGDLDTTVSKIGMRFHSARSGVTVVALPPDGRMIAYNEDTKKIYKVDMRRFSLNSKSVNVSHGSSKGAYFATGSKSKIAGVEAVQFVNYKPKELPMIQARRARALMGDGRSTSLVVPGEIWVTADIVLPRTFMFIISKITQITEAELAQMYGCTTGSMVKAPVPLRIFRVRDDGTKIMVLNTRSATKESVTEKNFAVPAGLKPVKNEMALLMDDDGSFGFGGPPPADLGAESTKPASHTKRTMSDLEKELGISPMVKGGKK